MISNAPLDFTLISARSRACLGPRFLRRRQRNAENPAKRHAIDALIPIATAAGSLFFNWNAAYSGSEGIGVSLHRDFAYRAAAGHGNKQTPKRTPA